MNPLPLRLLVLLSLLAWVAPHGLAAEPAGSAQATADPDWAAFQNAMQPPPAAKDTDFAGRIRWGMMFVQGVLTAGQTFYDRHPNDPRRWDCVMQMVKQFGSWTGGINGREDGKKAADAVFDEAARAQWAIKLQALRVAGVAARDISETNRLILEQETLVGLRNAAAKAAPAERAAALAAVKAEVDRLAAKYPDEPLMGSIASGYIKSMERAGATREEVQAQWAAFAAYPGTALANAAPAGAREAAARQQLGDRAKLPIELAFTAVDGRKVDLRDLRGKVVLVEFWATWCGPCKEEIPNLKKIYAAYHGNGFEIVGITLENARLADADTAAEREQKLAKARQVLVDFTAKQEMPWPQYFDGKYRQNTIAVDYLINAIPAMFLLGKDGRIITTHARGPQLETAVKAALGL
jgi:thiol-disulfide isomerase/thioredoxin